MSSIKQRAAFARAAELRDRKLMRLNKAGKKKATSSKRNSKSKY